MQLPCLALFVLVAVVVFGTNGIPNTYASVGDDPTYGIFGNSIILPDNGVSDLAAVFGYNPYASRRGYFDLSTYGGMAGLGRRGIRPCRYEVCRRRRIRRGCRFIPIQRRIRRRGFCLGCPVNICRYNRRYSRLRRRLCRRMGICFSRMGDGIIGGVTPVTFGQIHAVPMRATVVQPVRREGYLPQMSIPTNIY